MFTGLIEDTGYIKSIKQSHEGRLIKISSNVITRDSKTGDSISINGACQTVTEIKADLFTVFVSKITCSITTLGIMSVNTKVNLERAMLPSSRFGGHIVQGHVDGKGVIDNIVDDANGKQVTISCEKELLRYMVNRGSVTVDGISLTVVSVTDNGFEIYLIPETLKSTIINDWKTGDEINIEVDILAKYVEKMLQDKDENPADKKDRELKKKLFEEGFI